jgi:hypothetical protein
MYRSLRIYLIAALSISLFALIGCSDPPREEVKAKEPEKKEKPSAPITGRQGFQMTYPTARAWAPDAQPLRVRSMNLEGIQSEAGKAPLWEVVYVSQSRRAQRGITWSASGEGNLHKGVYGGSEDSWGGPSGQEHPYDPSMIQVDTAEALQKATETAAKYLKSPGDKPMVNFLLQYTPRYPEPVWVVLWGQTIGTAEYSVTIGATSGKVLAHF